MKKIILCYILMFFIFLNLDSVALAVTPPPSVSGQGVVVMDATTGNVLYGKNEHTPFPPASPTKLMTVLLTLENCSLDEIVKVGEVPPTIDGSKIYIDFNEEMTVKDMLYAVIMVSANDCAEALAEHIAGSKEAFAELMNKRAKELGCKDTTFKNPHGLYEKGHVTSAYDLALIERALLQHEEYINISKTKTLFLEPTNIYKEKRPLWNDNRLLHDYEPNYYPYVIAGKTGYTDECRHSFVASAQKGNSTFIVTILRDENKTYFSDTPKLFEWAFANFSTEKIYSKDDIVAEYTTSNGTTVPLKVNSDIYFTKSLSSTESPQFSFDSEALKNKFFIANQPVSTGKVSYGKDVYTFDLLSTKTYEKFELPFFGDFLTTNNNTINYKLLYTIIGVALIIIVILLIIGIKYVDKRRKNNRYIFKKRN